MSDICPICLDSISLDELAVLSCIDEGCGAMYHSACVSEWLTRGSGCATCRRQVQPEAKPVKDALLQQMRYTMHYGQQILQLRDCVTQLRAEQLRAQERETLLRSELLQLCQLPYRRSRSPRRRVDSMLSFIM